MVFFTSDLHFYHDNIIKHTNRPFKNAEEMNKALIKKWNAKISFSDDIYILGDFTMKGPDLAAKVLSELKGNKHLILGNHDNFATHPKFDASLFVSIKNYDELTFLNTHFVLFHYPIMEWNGFYKGSIDLHGHQHNHAEYNYNNLQQGIRWYDVGVDANFMSPVSAEEIITFFQMQQ